MDRPRHIQDFDLMTPRGRTLRFRRMSRRDLIRSGLTVAALLAVSLALWALSLFSALRGF